MGTKTPARIARDETVRLVYERLKPLGFKRYGSTFNREISDGLIQVIAIEMGLYHPTRSKPVETDLQDPYGYATANIGVWLPEVGVVMANRGAHKFVLDSECCVRVRLGHLGPERQDLWWTLDPTRLEVDVLIQRLVRDALPFLERFSSRGSILDNRQLLINELRATGPSEFSCAIIYAAAGNKSNAVRELQRYVNRTMSENPEAGDGPTEWARSLANYLALGDIHFD